jgi:hypothetical protein
MVRAASFSRDRRYRYSLTRHWAEGPTVAWVMLNPSTADARQDDPTIRRCIAFSRAWGFGALEVVNLFGLRSPHPRDLVASDEPVGPGSDRALRAALREAEVVVAAWGNLSGALRGRDELVQTWLPADTACLGVTRQGAPRHPLYVAGATLPVPLGAALDGGALTEIEGTPTMAA